MRWIPIVLLFLFPLQADSAEQAASIEGTMTDGGSGVAGALVAAISATAQDPAAITRSDAQGRFRLGPLAPGKYGVTATVARHTAGLLR
jgi:hypothetical protein